MIKINENQLALTNAMYITLEEHILDVSRFNNIPNKFLTGFGWSQNLSELYNRKIINSFDEKEITNVMESLTNLQFKHEISIHEWVITICKYYRLTSILSLITIPNPRAY